jgi:hypothetical protein
MMLLLDKTKQQWQNISLNFLFQLTEIENLLRNLLLSVQLRRPTRSHELFEKRGGGSRRFWQRGVGGRGKEGEGVHDDALGEKPGVICGGNNSVADNLQEEC